MARLREQGQVSGDMIAIAAAHRITPRVVATWYPGLIRTPRVLVPIELDALMVRDPGGSWADCGARPAPTNAGNGAPPSAPSLPPPFTNLPAPRPAGAYLQWYLPRALTSGMADAQSNTMTFPPIPDRWLVLRISAQERQPGKFAPDVARGRAAGAAVKAVTPRRAVTGWVLEAGAGTPVVTPLDSWTEPGVSATSPKPMTALGHGDFSWAGYFDCTLNRLSFYDGSLNGVTGPIAYIVCGWYADPTNDPLGGQNVTSFDSYNAQMDKLGWTVGTHELKGVAESSRAYLNVANYVGLLTGQSTSDAVQQIERVAASGGDGAPSATWWPSGTLLHGAVVGISWPGTGDTAEAGGPPAATSIKVAAGNTMAETMGALVATANHAPNQAQLVEALELNELADLDLPDGLARLDVRLHATSFASMAGGPADTEPLTVAPSGPIQAPPKSQPAPGPGVFATQLSGGRLIAGPFEKAPYFERAAQAGHLIVESGHSPQMRAEERVVAGGIHEVYNAITKRPSTPPSDPGGQFDALRSKPRLFTPRDPVLLIAGGKRAFAHDSGVYTVDGKVECRLTPVTDLAWNMPGTSDRPSVKASNILDRGVENGSVPRECEDILEETALLDTGGADVIAAHAASKSAAPATYDVAAAQRNIAVEQTAWYALRDPRVDHTALIAKSGVAGHLPAAFAIAPPSAPWNPVHLDWAVEFFPTPRSQLQPTPTAQPAWTLGELDYTLDSSAPAPTPGTGLMFTGRAPVTGGASKALSTAIQRAQEQAARIGGTGPVPLGIMERALSPQAVQLAAKYVTMADVSAIQAGALNAGPTNQPAQADPASAAAPASQLDGISAALAHMDVLSCGLNGLLTQLRGGVPPDGVTAAPGGTLPTPFFGVRGGLMRIARLRLVDGFGQYVDLCGSDATHSAQGYLVSGPLTVPGMTGLMGLPPRFTAPSRAWFRWMAADMPGVEADYQTSPVCAYLLPNHLDGDLEFFNADGSGAGSLLPVENGRVIWQNAPGLVTAAGNNPAPALKNAHAVDLAEGLIDWGLADAGQDREPALSALLRTIDSTRWSLDPFAHAGDEHLSLLVGHPVCVMRAMIRLDVIDPVTTPDSVTLAVPIRLGALVQWQDGLLGYFIEDDYTTLHVADAAAPGMARPLGAGQGFLTQANLVAQYYQDFASDLVALSPGATQGGSPVKHPYVDTSGVVWIRPNQTVALTLLVEPLTTVHATVGLVPRKEIGMRREWVQDSLKAIAPTFSFGPTLVDPKHIRMPLATDLNGTWVWDYRADAATWAESPVSNATDNALLAQDPPTGSEGWLKLEPPKPGGTSS